MGIPAGRIVSRESQRGTGIHIDVCNAELADLVAFTNDDEVDALDEATRNGTTFDARRETWLKLTE